jgi:uncharacterized protein (DUF1778 family)
MATITPEAEATKFLITVSPREKRVLKTAAAASGISMAEFARRAIVQMADGPTPEEIAEARHLAEQIDRSADRMAAMLDRAIAAAEDPGRAEREERLRAEVAAEVAARRAIDLAPVFQAMTAA